MREYSDRQTVDIHGLVINSHKQLDHVSVAFRDELHGISDPFFGRVPVGIITVQVMEAAPGITFHHSQAGCMATLILHTYQGLNRLYMINSISYSGTKEKQWYFLQMMMD